MNRRSSVESYSIIPGNLNTWKISKGTEKHLHIPNSKLYCKLYLVSFLINFICEYSYTNNDYKVTVNILFCSYCKNKNDDAFATKNTH